MRNPLLRPPVIFHQPAEVGERQHQVTFQLFRSLLANTDQRAHRRALLAFSGAVWAYSQGSFGIFRCCLGIPGQLVLSEHTVVVDVEEVEELLALLLLVRFQPPRAGCVCVCACVCVCVCVCARARARECLTCRS